MMCFSLSLCSSFLRSSSSTSLSSSLLPIGECVWLRWGWCPGTGVLLSSFSPSFPFIFLLSLSRSGEMGELSVSCSSLCSAFVTEKRPTVLWTSPSAGVTTVGEGRSAGWTTGVTWKRPLREQGWISEGVSLASPTP